MNNKKRKQTRLDQQGMEANYDQQFLRNFIKYVSDEMKQYYLNVLNRENERVLLRTSSTLEYILIKDIIRCEAAGRYTNVHYEDNRCLMVSLHLKEMEKLLRPDTFIRCHNSHIVNMYMITRFNKSDGGYFVMCNGDHVPVARARKEEVLRELNAFYRSGEAFK